jgi:hypothetical protein
MALRTLDPRSAPHPANPGSWLERPVVCPRSSSIQVQVDQHRPRCVRGWVGHGIVGLCSQYSGLCGVRCVRWACVGGRASLGDPGKGTAPSSAATLGPCTAREPPRCPAPLIGCLGSTWSGPVCVKCVAPPAPPSGPQTARPRGVCCTRTRVWLGCGARAAWRAVTSPGCLGPQAKDWPCVWTTGPRTRRVPPRACAKCVTGCGRLLGVRSRGTGPTAAPTESQAWWTSLDLRARLVVGVHGLVSWAKQPRGVPPIADPGTFCGLASAALLAMTWGWSTWGASGGVRSTVLLVPRRWPRMGRRLVRRAWRAGCARAQTTCVRTVPWCARGL